MSQTPNPNPNPKPNSSPLTTATATATTTRARKKAYRESAEGVLRRELDLCSKRGDLAEALRLYDSARAASVPLSLHHYNVLLYLCCSSSSSSPDLDRGFEILRHMAADPSVAPNEATFTSAARLAAAKRDPALAFDLVRRMAAAGIPPRLRSYGPALFGFCDAGDLAGAHAVEAHMAASGVAPEEPELAALLAANARAGDGGHVYRVLHRLRSVVRVVSERTAEIAERWFGSEAAAEAGVEEWDEEKVREGVANGGGGWHGQGWLGKGPWSLGRSEMDEDGVCRRCAERLVCIDIDPSETEDFAKSLAALASQREVKADFLGFQEWLERNGPFDAVIDAANVGLYNQKNFSFFQLNSVVNGMRQMSRSNKLPLIVLHSRRVKGGPADAPNNKKLIESWRRAGALYATPPGSNDDWYWLYAAVSCRSLVVTNDEMRDHLFQLLGTSFFPRWKEKHQVRLTFSRRGPAFHMPPPYSRVIQESEGGSWHIPTLTGDDIEAPRQWICATRNTIRASSRPPSRLSQMGW
ncbi:proteinaceous RNase P 1, chloroplastic/mitochondrial [Ananas comosus]|uniref:ribonuclease P n=1 Tax=Ananas comosus TaxID=4615 RepID=A0A6P5EZU1_ANACO|nr:proteinaceous RNase P 1, chloroplastic/mitochondrial [Ananas comosus]XP_020089074.1 proteinaceous RNase P 1, chloroplastic/mitochondrial [Ananas comosus]XP_020089075.1 proteinaceous RNase P 1, chloroplastic/mitochondrial [Ananas comosus]XP_020089076.1 proteinaceous RNase P 1, chloroplastic/mitochondrial [Ananas comosus]